ncbi:DegV family protein [Corynebacterium sp. ES2794-CONJ1]|uniref:DegV family protein n=1 Tax=unclassified Corynebacterium TaxID=2624378 RepID=UPI00216A49F0|nr:MULTISPECIES: DegV family protein [unclassified Corynebacterium]MCS4490514.1 DegV family protein [Corynebacterium sp. ES2775-CONJ]MCS4492294.1 DegV family protein [Corynebacterium sp. ES2715-CONJ3]MCS4532514.1 DegV family protein [Corynebacterium sp. ES2730-CONJ]MCU9519909.1 DegV family protein [Corynebacterium sp. ES2794-CONJ1]
MPVRIVTDSSAGLPHHVVDELDITVIDLHIVNSDHDQSTSGLSALELTAQYARQLERGGDEGVLALHLSKELSSTWSAAVTAASIFNQNVAVVDTQSIGMSVGAAAMAAARIAQDGAPLPECIELAEDTLARSATWLFLPRIEQMWKSGRISAATAMLSTTLAIKPILQVRSGRIELAAKTRTQAKALTKLTELIVQRAANLPVFIAIQQHEAKDAARLLEKQLRDNLPKGSAIMITDMDPILAVHCGVGAVGVSTVFSQAPDDN